ncbi:hypothetical protein E2C01_063990 [Portunus trituberculatus]|uniref:Uncharacterized protein n=1 Tax=Portunus trituberculatus TaxID=210409 RepID=A0A5B7HJ50_PORTR|nr:hypothetical protein [Portunus trituberculatus]
MAVSLLEGRLGVYTAFMPSYGFAAIPKLSRLLPSVTHYPILDGQLHRVSVSRTFWPRSELGQQHKPSRCRDIEITCTWVSFRTIL